MSTVLKRLTVFASFVLFAFVLTGCGVIFGGSAQEVSIASSPDGAEVEIDHVNRTVTTPATLELKRKHSYELTFSKEGYETETASVESNLRAGILVLDILFTGLLGVAIDAGTGAWNSLSPENVNVSLAKMTAAAPGPETIDVRITTDGGTAKIKADEPVKVKVRRLP